MIGVGVETVGHRRRGGALVRPAVPVPLVPAWAAGKYGLTQLQNLAALPPTGAVVIAGAAADRRRLRQPRRVLALVERR